ncbi:heterokaryon incompatibility protein-domain-containing protein [Aspergillus multicolor]|uniref:heterokaryon incompatibility protein-domain-containing protein n=1 Tax=Aspergillus multicolor TaxID=41759 RepID=UPI003CCD5AED
MRVCLDDNVPNFDALSYVWGRDLAPEPISPNGHEKIVTANLAGILKYFTKRHIKSLTVPPLWIDAPCINQDDNEEKGHRVGMMQDIYTSASRVLSWLGEDPWNRVYAAFRLFYILLKEKQTAGADVDGFYSMNWPSRHTELLIEEGGSTEHDEIIPNPHWASLFVLVNLPYWY